MKILFTVPGEPRGYYAQGYKPNWARMRRYTDWKMKVQLYAIKAGLKLPLKATEAAPVTINTAAYFKTRLHCDPGNVQKGACDALFYGAKGGGDKYTAGGFSAPLYDADNPRVEIEVICEGGGATK